MQLTTQPKGRDSIVQILRRGLEREQTRFGLLEILAGLSCLLAFLHVANTNYRQGTPFLGPTVPPFQREIVEGTAPAPYVYRQGVPQVRDFLESWMLPGHAAFVVDALLGIACMVAGVYLARTLLGRRASLLGLLVTTVALITVYPNDKPEAIAAISLVAIVSLLILHERHGLAFVVLIGLIPVRTDIPVIFAVAVILAAWLLFRRRSKWPTFSWLYVVVVAAGLVYLALAKFVLWPEAAYPPGTPVFVLFRNITTPFAWSGLLLALILIVIGFSFAMRELQIAKEAHQSGAPANSGFLGLFIFVMLYAVALLVVAMVEEFRVFQPLLPVALILGSRQLQIESTPRTSDKAILGP